MLQRHTTLVGVALLGTGLAIGVLFALVFMGPQVSQFYPELDYDDCSGERSWSHDYLDGTVVYGPGFLSRASGQEPPCWSPPQFGLPIVGARVTICDAWSQTLQGGGVLLSPAYDESPTHDGYPDCWELPAWIGEDDLGPPPEVSAILPAAGAGQVAGEFDSIGEGPWNPVPDLCGEVGTAFDVHLNTYVEARTALEFPIAAPPYADATIGRATLSIFHDAGNGLDSIAFYGYAGDGAIDVGDIQVSGGSVIDTHRSAQATPVYEHHDVTALVSPEAIASGWVGFSLRQEPPILEEEGSGHEYACPTATHFPNWFPILTISWTSSERDEDGDGVLDPDDECPVTVVDEFPELLERRYWYDGTLLLSRFANYPPHPIAETAGCSASQIIASAGLKDEAASGLDKSALDVWIASHRGN